MDKNHKITEYVGNSMLIKCLNKGGLFSSTMWRQEIIKKDTCPCCGDTIQ